MREYPEQFGAAWLLLELLGRKDDIIKLLTGFDRPAPPHPLAGFLIYPYFDPTPYPNLMKILEREGVNRPPPLEIPFACPSAEEVAEAAIAHRP